MAKKSKAQTERKGAVAPALMSEQATSQLVTWLTRVPDLDEVLRKAGIARHKLSSLLSDDEIFQAVETRIDALLSVPFRLTPSEGPAADFLIDQMNQHINSIIRCAINARFYGYSVSEAVYEQDNEITDPSGYRGLKSITEKPMEWFEPKGNGELRYYPDNGAYGFEGQLVDTKYKFFLTRHNPTYRQPQGTALLSRLYWPWYFRTNGWKFWAKFLERFGSPILVGTTGSDTQEMVNSLLSAHGSAVIAIDSEDKVEAIGSGGANGGQSFVSFDEALTRRIAKVVLGQTLTSGTDSGGSRALGEVHDNVRLDKRNSDIRLILPTVQRVIDALCELNGLPYHEITLADGKGLEKDRAERDKILNEMGVEFTRKYFEDEYNLEAEHFDVAQPGQPVPTFTPAPKQNFSFKADAQNITPEQQQVDNLAPASYSLLDTEQIKALVLASETAEELQGKLFELLPNAPLEQFNEVLSQALFTADLLGFKHSNEGA